jgi:hypothetical protein
MRSEFIHRLRIEQLERRDVLSGDVTVAVVGGDLVITGDASDNYLFIYQNVGGDWIVHGGRQLSGGSAVTGTETDVNGQSTPQTFAGVTGDLLIDMAGGNDEIEISNGDVLGVADIDLGAGDNHLILTTAFELPTPRFETNDASAEVRGALDFTGAVTVTSDTGDDSVYIDVDVTMTDDFTFAAGDGDDFVRLAGAGTWTVGGDVLLTFGTGDDVFNSDSLAINVTGNFGVTQGDAGSNGAEIFLVDSTVGGNVTITGAAGRNAVKLDSLDAGVVSLTLGAGADEVDVLDLTATSFACDLGDGDDRDVRFENITADTTISLAAGSGLDIISIQTLAATTVTVTGGDDADGIIAFDITATTVSFDSGDGTDVVGVYEVDATTLSVLTGLGSEGGGFIYGLVVGTCNITGTLTVDSGGGLDNVLLGSVTAATGNITTGDGSDGLIVMFSDIDNATFNSGADLDIVGAHDTVFQNLDVLLGAGNDQLWLGGVTASTSADLDGEADGGEFREPDSNTITGLVKTSLTDVAVS